MAVIEQLSAAERRDIAAACERLCLDYAHLADAGRRDEWAALFAEDAELAVFGRTHKGRAAIRAAAGGGSGSTLHMISNIRIDPLGPDEAEGTAYVAAYAKAADAPAAPPAPSVVGIYRDRYRRTADGWRFARRAFEPFLRAGA